MSSGLRVTTSIVPPMPPSSKSACGDLKTFDLADDVGRQHQVVEAARRVQLVEDEPVGGRERVAVQQRARQRRGQAAQVHALAFAEVAADDDAGHALQSFGEILVGELADVLGIERVDHADRLALGLERLAQAAADAGDHDLFDLARVRRLRRQGRRCLPGQCQRDRSRE